MNDNPYHIHGENNPGRWLVACDHATNRVPDWIGGGTLGLPDADMARHIAFDIGAAALTRHLADLLNSRAVLSNFSRLVIDPNRGEDDPTLMMRLYDGTLIPGNRHATAADLQERIDRLYRPYHDAYEELAGRRDDTVICSVHSFTPQLRGRPPRPWQVGVLYANDRRLSDPFLENCRAQGWITGDNEPYTGFIKGDAIDRHALRSGRPNVLIEVRNDLISDGVGQRAWAERLAPVLVQTLAQTGL